MKEILLTILGIVLFIIIVMAILFHKSISQFRKMLKQAAEAREARRIAEEEEYFKRTSTKHYHKDEEEDAPKFHDDYFKSSDPEEPQQKPQQETTARRTTQTDSGVTIIDDRSDKQTDRKIFDDSEGEYVEFEEIK